MNEENTTITAETHTPSEWLAACPSGEARTIKNEGGATWSVDRRPVNIDMEAGASAVQSVVVSPGRTVTADGAAMHSDPLVGVFAELQALCPDSSDTISYSSFQDSVRKMIERIATKPSRF